MKCYNGSPCKFHLFRCSFFCNQLMMKEGSGCDSRMRVRWRQVKVVAVVLGLAYLLFLLWASYQLSGEERVHKLSKSTFQRWMEWIWTGCPPLKASSFEEPHYMQGKFQENFCGIDEESRMTQSDIQMEKEWETIKVAYPQYVHTVSGWIETQKVPSFTAKGTESRPLRVFIIPHSHQDPGWLFTYEQYYNMDTRSTLQLTVDKLTANPSWRFIWAEVTYLAKWWWAAADEQRTKLKQLVERGQLELVTGGWVMTDEAVTHYAAMLDQLIEGQLWLQDNLGVRPKIGWAIDPFGHSPTMAYLLDRAGLSSMVIQRIHFAVKRHLAASQSLEFYWRQAWDKAGMADILTHAMPFVSYAIDSSCGPDHHVCCQFDFYGAKCKVGFRAERPKPVSPANIHKLSAALWEQLNKKAQLYKSRVLLVPHGDDFRYSFAGEWDLQMENLAKLQGYINNQTSWATKIEFGTLSDYFAALEADRKLWEPDQKFPLLTGDFFPYNDRDDQYWTGFYTSRPFYKYMARRLQSKLRLVEIWYSLSLASSYFFWSPAADRKLWAKYPSLESVRRALGVFQHHDAITGTSRKAVVKDYAGSLQTAMSVLDELASMLVINSLTTQRLYLNHGLPPQSIVKPVFEWRTATEPEKPVIISDISSILVVTNPLTTARVEVVQFYSSMPVLVVNRKTGKVVETQINPTFVPGTLTPYPEQFQVLFLAVLDALSSHTFSLKPIKPQSPPLPQDLHFATVSLLGVENSHFSQEFQTQDLSVEEPVTVENEHLKAEFSTCTGYLNRVTLKRAQVVQNVEVKMVTYGTGSWSNPFRDKSGAYIFLPDGQAVELNTDRLQMVVMQGGLRSTVMTRRPGVAHALSLDLHQHASQGLGLLVENLVELTNKDWDNKELVMRIETSLSSPTSPHSFCVDLNGFQMHRKVTRRKMTLQGNFHPMTTMAHLEDGKHLRLALLSDQAHGVASLQPGWLEVVLDRRLKQDDWRGLAEPVQDNVPSPSRFFLMLEDSSEQGKESAACFPSLRANYLSEALTNPPLVQVVGKWDGDLLPEWSWQGSAMSCNLKLVNLRTLPAHQSNSPSALMVVHSVGIDCAFSPSIPLTKCNHRIGLHMDMFARMNMEATEMSLTGTVATQNNYTNASGEVPVPSMHIRTFKVTFRPKQK